MNFLKKRIFVFIALLPLCLPLGLSAQQDRKDTVERRSIYFNVDPLSHLIDGTHQPENVLNDVHRVDKSFALTGDFYQRLSSPGSPSKNIFFRPRDINDRDAHALLFEPYLYTADNIRFYQTNRPYSNLKYSNDIDNAQYFSITHSQNVWKSLNVALTYDVNYADGTFDKSQTMNQFFNFTANYISAKGRYRAAASFIRNRAYVLESGGILSDSLFLNDAYSKPETYPVNLENAYSKYKTADFSLFQTVRLDMDTAGETRVLNAGALNHQIRFNRSSRLYRDELMKTTDSLSKRQLRNILSWTNDVYNREKAEWFLPLTFGLEHELLLYADSLNSDLNNMITPFARIGLRSPLLDVRLEGRYVLGGSYFAGDCQVKLDSRLYFSTQNRDNALGLKASYSCLSAYYILSHFSSERLVWDNVLEKTGTLYLNLSYLYKDMIEAFLSYAGLDKASYVDNDMRVRQTSVPTHLFQVGLKHDCRAGRFGFGGFALLQKASDDYAVRVPLFQARQTVYVEVDLFKGRLKTQFGLDLNYNTAYYADMYSPLLGCFVRQDEEKVGNYLYADIYINAKIDKCNLFLSLSHPYAGLLGYNYINTPLYPHEGLAFRWGLSWDLWE